MSHLDLFSAKWSSKVSCQKAALLKMHVLHHELLKLLSSEAKTTPYMGRTDGIRPFPADGTLADAYAISPPSPSTATRQTWLNTPWKGTQPPN